MQTSKQARRYAKGLFRAAQLNGVLDENRVRQAIDALIAQAYDLSLRQYEVVLDHFALLRRMEEREVGEYRSKRLRLEAFEDLQGDA